MNAFGKYILLLTLSFTLIEAKLGKISIFNYHKKGFSCKVRCIPQCQNSGKYQNGTCMCPDDYSGTRCEMFLGNYVLYWNFDSLENFTLMEGNQQRDFNAFSQGQVNSGLSVDGHHAQWIDLGIHTEACITRPNTCGAAGGAVSLWLKEIECSDLKGMITSTRYAGTGFSIWCQDSSRFVRLIYLVTLLEKDLYVTGPKHNDWFHVVFNFIGPSETEGIRVYNDGEQVGGDSMVVTVGRHTVGDGKIVFGRVYTESNMRYVSVQMDELLFFNHALTAEEIFKLSQIAT